MKLLVVLSIVNYCLAMPTPTNNATEVLVRMMEKMKDRLFSAQCVTENPTNDPKMTMYTPPMECMWPKMHNMSATVDQWVTMMKTTGCTVPQENMLMMMKRSMQQRNYEDSPIIRKFPTGQCGMCGRRIQCCPATQFLVQSYRSTACESAPCQVEPMTVENWNYVREKYPEWNLPTTNEPCNFASIMRQSMMQSKVFPFMRTMYMQLVGSEMPTMNCQMVENMCACCCSGFMWQAGKCVPEPEIIQTSTMVSGMTTTTMMAEMTSMVTQTMIEETTMTTMTPVVETTTMGVPTTTTVRPVPVNTTPKTLYNEDAGAEAEEEEDNRKRRSAEEDSSSEEEELNKEAEKLAEIVAEEVIAHEGEGGPEDVVAEVIAEEIAEEKKEEWSTMEAVTTPEIEIASEALTEGTTIKATEGTTILPTEAITNKPTEAWTEGTTIKPTEAVTTTIKPTEAWTEGTTAKPTIPTETWTLGTTIKPWNATNIVNATITNAANWESTAAPTPVPTKVETPIAP